MAASNREPGVGSLSVGEVGGVEDESGCSTVSASNFSHGRKRRDDELATPPRTRRMVDRGSKTAPCASSAGSWGYFLAVSISVGLRVPLPREPPRVCPLVAASSRAPPNEENQAGNDEEEEHHDDDGYRSSRETVMASCLSSAGTSPSNTR